MVGSYDPLLAPGPTAGICALFSFELYVKNIYPPYNEYWLNYENPDVWGGPDLASVEMFNRWWYDFGYDVWRQATAQNQYYNMYMKQTAHDNDLHNIRAGWTVTLGQWITVSIDVGQLLVDLMNHNNVWWREEFGFDILKGRLKTVGFGVETFLAQFEGKWDNVILRMNEEDDKLEVNGGTVTKIGTEIQVTIPSGSGWAQAGYVTKNQININNRKISVDVTELDSLHEMHLYIGLTKVTSSDPWNEANFYRIYKTRMYGGRLQIQRKVNGVVNMVLDRPWLYATGNLKIEIVDSIIRFYEDDQFRYAETYSLSSYNCYIYVYTSTDRSQASGTDKFNNFKFEYCDVKFWMDDFNDGNYNGWTVYSGTWSVINGELKGQGQDATIYSNTQFSSDRIVQSKLKTVTAGNNPWNVAVLMIKWVNAQNQITTRLFTNGILELIMWKNGQCVYQKQINAGLSPYDWHTFKVVVGHHSITNNPFIEIFIDQYPYHFLYAESEYFDDIAGSVGYQTGPESRFDDMIVHW